MSKVTQLIVAAKLGHFDFRVYVLFFLFFFFSFWRILYSSMFIWMHICAHFVHYIGFPESSFFRPHRDASNERERERSLSGFRIKLMMT